MRITFALLATLSIFSLVFAENVCGRHKFGYKALDPKNPYGFYVCLGRFGHYSSLCPQGFKFNVTAQRCIVDGLGTSSHLQEGNNGAKGLTNYLFNFNQKVIIDHPQISSAFMMPLLPISGSNLPQQHSSLTSSDEAKSCNPTTTPAPVEPCNSTTTPAPVEPPKTTTCGPGSQPSTPSTPSAGDSSSTPSQSSTPNQPSDSTPASPGSEPSTSPTPPADDSSSTPSQSSTPNQPSDSTPANPGSEPSTSPTPPAGDSSSTPSQSSTPNQPSDSTPANPGSEPSTSPTPPAGDSSSTPSQSSTPNQPSDSTPANPGSEPSTCPTPPAGDSSSTPASPTDQDHTPTPTTPLASTPCPPLNIYAKPIIAKCAAIPPDCRSVPNGSLLRDRALCNKFYTCMSGHPIPQECGNGLYFDTKKNVCNFKSLVDCKNCATLGVRQNTKPRSPVKALKAIVEKPSCNGKLNGTSIRDSKLCNKYYICINGKTVTRFCNPGEWFDIKLAACNLKNYVTCDI